MGSFLSSGENKKELIRFLVRCCKENCDVLGDLDVYVAFDDSYIKLGSNGQSRSILALALNHEEADTRMLLHAKNIGKENAANIVIHTPTTDVFLICLVWLNKSEVAFSSIQDITLTGKVKE